MQLNIKPIAVSAVILLGLTACTSGTPPVSSSSSAATSGVTETITLITHDSFALSPGILDGFTASTGIKVDVQAAGDAGELVNKLVLTKDSPLGDVVYGIDNTFASRAVKAGVLEDFVSSDLTDSESQFLLPYGQGSAQLTPIDYGDVCVNVDHNWFTEHKLAEPTVLDDFLKPEYKNLLTVEAANSSSPGLAFLLATIDAYGTGWQAYWKKLIANGTQVAANWEDAYNVDFSGSAGKGDRPLVVSYASSPPYEVKDGVAPTGALLNTCFRQTEYAGVIAGTKHEEAAKTLINFLFSTVVQNDIPEQMYVFPANADATLPADWAKFAKVATNPFSVAPAEIDANREKWLTEWAAIATP